MQVIKRERQIEATDHPEKPSFQWVKTAPKKSFADKLTRNLALASALLICVAAIRLVDNQPETQSVFEAIQENLSLDLDETLGKLTFVSNMLPEASLVFWNSGEAATVMAPVSGEIVHVWDASEPYISMASASSEVRCAADGEVMVVAHGEDEELIVRVRHDSGLETIYGNLSECFVGEGDAVYEGDILGKVRGSEQVFFELRQDGRSIDPTYLMREQASTP